jgi:hypothetical protein
MADFTQPELRALLDKLNAKRAARGDKPLEMAADGVHVTLDNGALATWTKSVNKAGAQYAKWVIATGAPSEYLARVRTPKGQQQQGKPVPMEEAAAAFNRYYNRRDYKSPALRKAAIERDKKYSPSRKGVKDMTRIKATTRFTKNPAKFDYPGLDDGPLLSKSRGNTGALAAWRAKNPKGSASLKYYKKTKKNPNPAQVRRSRRQVQREIKRQAGGEGSEDEQSVSSNSSTEETVEEVQQQQQAEPVEQTGGRAVSLKTAVRLLRNYYSNRYQQ